MGKGFSAGWCATKLEFSHSKSKPPSSHSLKAFEKGWSWAQEEAEEKAE